MKIIIKLSLILFLCLPALALADIPERIKSDFATVSGTIIMPIGDQYLVDLDAVNNLKEGDILTLVMEGERIINPETKEILEVKELAKGFLQVTKVNSGYSYVKLLGEAREPEKGAQVKRYVRVPTIFNALQSDPKLAEELRLALPQLEWLDNTDGTAPELVFTLTQDSLIVTNNAGDELQKYQYKDGKLVVAMGAIHQADSFQTYAENKNKSFANQAITGLVSTIGLGGKDKRLENPGITQSQQLNDGIWTGPNLDGNPVGIAVGDFDGDGQLETAVAMEDHLRILRLTAGKLAPIAIVKFATAVNLLSLDSADLDADGKPELYLSANVGINLNSQVVEFTQGKYKNTISQVPWFFRTVTTPDQGRTLLAQTTDDAQNHFNGKPFIVLRNGNKFSRGTEVPLPTPLNLFSFTQFQGLNNDPLYASLSSGDDLNVTTPQGTRLWQSSNNFGGSEIFFYNQEENSSTMLQPVFMQQRLLLLPSGAVLAPYNEGSRLFKRMRKYDNSHVVAMKWDGVTLHEEWQTADQAGYLADFALADADNDGEVELIMAINFKHQNLLQKGHSSIVIYELNH